MRSVLRHRFRTVAPAVAALALLASAPAASAATGAASASREVLTPSQVDAIVANDTKINNEANSALSVSLQDSHESCLQAVLDDASYRGEIAAGQKTLGAAFQQEPTHAFVPRQQRYPAFFSVLASDRQASEPTTTNLLTYVKTSSAAHWKLSSSSGILGPTATGVSVPAVATDSQGYATSLDVAAPDGLAIAPDEVAARVASAFTAEASTGKLPSGISAQFGPKNAADPHVIATAYASLGKVTTTITTAVPPAASAGRPSADCPYPAYRLKDGGALVTFAVFSTVTIKVPAGEVVEQPANRASFGVLLPPGAYSSVTVATGDMGVAIVPPAGSKSPVEVIGQASEGLSETGTAVKISGSAPPTAGGAGGPSNAAAIAKSVDPGIVDVNDTLGYLHAEGAGTGMVLTRTGEILTNNHVIDGATSVTVTDVGNGKTYDAKVVGYDPAKDVAVLQLQGASGLTTIATAASAGPRKGEPVVAIGNAGGTGGTPAFAGGTITAVNQSITANDEADGTSEQLSGLLETDADIQLGDSGGPLVNGRGQVVGMDTAASSEFTFAGTGASTTHGYSIPIATALSIVKQIVSGKRSSSVHVGATAFLGVSTISTGKGFGGSGHPIAPMANGAIIESVVSGAPAAKAGLVSGDTITSFAGHSVDSSNSLTTRVLATSPSATVKVSYLDQYDVRHTVKVHLRPGPPQ